MKKYVADGRKLSDWIVWTALETYLQVRYLPNPFVLVKTKKKIIRQKRSDFSPPSPMQLQERFGWDAFKKVFADYYEMRNFPGNNKGKMNLYAETFSRAVGMNLSGFFKSWGWPIEEDTEEALSHLPPWTKHPMAQYN